MRASQSARCLCHALPRREPLSARQPHPKHQHCLSSRRLFHDYFVTLLPSSSQHPDSRASGPSHKLPRADSTPHDDASGTDAARRPTSFVPSHSASNTRDLTVVRIPLKSAKHHFGVTIARGTRPYNEDRHQAGTIEVPAFAQRAPVSLTGRNSSSRSASDSGKKGDDDAGGGVAAQSRSGDPQVFYFGVFDGHGGEKCSTFLREKLHEYVESSAKEFGMESTLQGSHHRPRKVDAAAQGDEDAEGEVEHEDQPEDTAEGLAAGIVTAWKDTVGGYFRRFQPQYFPKDAGGKGEILKASTINDSKLTCEDSPSPAKLPTSSVEQVLTHAFLRADLDFIDEQVSETPITEIEPKTEEGEGEPDGLGRHTHHSHEPFLGGSTCSLALISTPTPTPFWHPSSPLTIVTAHLGDTRILLCSTESGLAIPLTSEHHPSSPPEATRLRRYAAAFTTDSFGEERFAAGLANTRAFGDVRAKRMGVSAEPEIRLVQLRPGECSFMVLVSDGVTGALSDQEIVDTVKEARTPEEGARRVVGLSEELAVGEKGDADNMTAMVVRMGGWERRSEGGGGSLRTKEQREWRRSEAADPRRGRT